MDIKIETFIKSDIDSVWQAWITPADIMRWNAASDDWHTTASSVDLKPGGRFSSRMEARDGSAGFDFSGTFTSVVQGNLIEYLLDDGRTVKVEFSPQEGGVRIVETFEAETTNPPEMQRDGWQAILDRFTRYVEGQR